MRIVLAGSLIVLACAPASAGELVFVNGNRLAGDLSNESLMVSTGAGLVEVAPDEVVALSRDEMRLRDGRVIQGTLVGGQVKARTSLGEIAIKVDELQSYRASEPADARRPGGRRGRSPRRPSPRHAWRPRRRPGATRASRATSRAAHGPAARQTTARTAGRACRTRS